MNEPLQTTLADAAAFLQREGIPYALVGGLAVSMRGQPRATADVDMVIAVDLARALRLLSALETSPFEPLFAGVQEVIERSFILPLRHRASGVKLDLALALSGFEQQVIARAEQRQTAGTLVAVATAEDLLLMKTLAARPQDDQDARGLVVALGNKLDWAYCEQVANDLGEALGQDLAGRIAALRAARQ